MNKSFGLLINGKWLNNKKTIDVLNPFDGKKDFFCVDCRNKRN